MKSFMVDSNDPVLIVFQAEKYGMIIPSNVPALHYFYYNRHHYDKKGANPDMFYFSAVNGFFPYTSRQTLIERYELMTKETYFFLPFSYDERVINTKTTLLSETKSLSPKDVIACGTRNRQRWYEIDELELAFTTTTTYFPRPENGKEKFTLREINRLRQLLNQYFHPRFSKLLALINTNFNAIMLLSKEESKYIDQISDRDSFIKLLYAFFEAGMYMRRWKGPGQPYPTEEKDTFTEESPDLNVSKALTKIKAMIVKPDPVYHRLRIIGNHYLDQNSLDYLFQQVYSGHLCMRVASSLFVNTASYYILNLFNEKISDYSYTVENIT